MKRDRVVTDVLGADIAITPSDLCNQQFRRSVFGGYHPDEVDVFLERVANVLEHLLTQMKGLKRQSEEQRELLEEYRQMEEALRNAIVSSQKFGQDTIENAKREAHALVQEGRLKKAQTELEAAKIPAKLSQDIRLLQEQRARLRRDMQAVLETHRQLLEGLIPEEDAVAAALGGAKEEEAAPEPASEPEPVPEPAPGEEHVQEQSEAIPLEGPSEPEASEPSVAEPADEPVDKQEEAASAEAAVEEASEEPETATAREEGAGDSEAVLLELASDSDDEEDLNLGPADEGDGERPGDADEQPGEDDVTDLKEEDPPYAGV